MKVWYFFIGGDTLREIARLLRSFRELRLLIRLPRVPLRSTLG